MGVDIYGIGNKEAYFRSNWWYWRPLWDYTCKNAVGVVSAEEHAKGHSNCGELLNAEQTDAVALILKELLDSGHTAVYAEHYNDGDYKEGFVQTLEGGVRTQIQKAGFELPSVHYPFSVKAVKDFAEFLASAKGMEIY